MKTILKVDPKRVLAHASEMIYGQFIEHFGSIVYGGIFDPQSPLADPDGFRSDVAAALARLDIPVIRWPGGCFASAYHWRDGIGPMREPVYDKAWCVEEPNTFGTDEFLHFCELVGAQPYLCTNAGTGTPEEMADWVEYCNEPVLGRNARLRRQNGREQPYGVRYWSIGNENYTGGEIGSRRAGEWGAFVRESAKMMRRVDASIQLFAAGVNDVDWNLALLREAGDLIDYLSIHEYFDHAWETNRLSGYTESLRALAAFERDIDQTQALLTALGLNERVRIAFDEWNLRGWYHPGISDFTSLNGDHAQAAAARVMAEANAQYTMADAVFTAGFLNLCLRRASVVSMANFSPTVSGRGLIGVRPDGIVLRPAYHVFDLLRHRLGRTVVDSYQPSAPHFTAGTTDVEALDAVCTLNDRGRLAACLINRCENQPLQIEMQGLPLRAATLYTIAGDTADSYNDFDVPDRVTIRETAVAPGRDILLPPHSVSVYVS